MLRYLVLDTGPVVRYDPHLTSPLRKESTMKMKRFKISLGVNGRYRVGRHDTLLDRHLRDLGFGPGDVLEVCTRRIARAHTVTLSTVQNRSPFSHYCTSNGDPIIMCTDTLYRIFARLPRTLYFRKAVTK